MSIKRLNDTSNASNSGERKRHRATLHVETDGTEIILYAGLAVHVELKRVWWPGLISQVDDGRVLVTFSQSQLGDEWLDSNSRRIRTTSFANVDGLYVDEPLEKETVKRGRGRPKGTTKQELQSRTRLPFRFVPIDIPNQKAPKQAPLKRSVGRPKGTTKHVVETRKWNALNDMVYRLTAESTSSSDPSDSNEFEPDSDDEYVVPTYWEETKSFALELLAHGMFPNRSLMGSVCLDETAPIKISDTPPLQEEAWTCIKCQNSTESPDDVLVLCDGCDDAYHQNCHDPIIESSLIQDLNSKFYCNSSSCQELASWICHVCGDNQETPVSLKDARTMSWFYVMVVTRRIINLAMILLFQKIQSTNINCGFAVMMHAKINLKL